MAVAYDARATSDWQSSKTSYTYSITIGSVSNPGLLTWVYVRWTTADHVSSVTAGGSAMTLKTSCSVGTPATGWQGLYELANPGTGSKTIEVTYDGTYTGASVSQSFSGVDGSNVLEAQNSAGTHGSSANVTVTTVNNNAFVVAAGRSDTGDFSAGTDTSDDYNDPNNGMSIISYSSNPKATPGDVTLNITIGDNENSFLNCGAVKAYVAASTSIKKIAGVAQASVKVADSVALASIKKMAGVANT